MQHFFVLDSFCVWNSLFKSFHPVTSKSLYLLFHQCLFCHFIATLLLPRIVYQYEYSINMLVYSFFWCLVQVSAVQSVLLVLFFLICFLAKQFCNCSISLSLFCGCNNGSVLQSSFCHVFCYFFISCICIVRHLRCWGILFHLFQNTPCHFHDMEFFIPWPQMSCSAVSTNFMRNSLYLTFSLSFFTSWTLTSASSRAAQISLSIAPRTCWLQKINALTLWLPGSYK